MQISLQHYNLNPVKLMRFGIDIDLLLPLVLRCREKLGLYAAKSNHPIPEYNRAIYKYNQVEQRECERAKHSVTAV